MTGEEVTQQASRAGVSQPSVDDSHSVLQKMLEKPH